jgi:hypothetical protein
MNRPPLPKGHLSILSPGFRYVPAASTDIAKTFARFKRESKSDGRLPDNVSPLKAGNRNFGG